jgi:hypothetical protein
VARSARRSTAPPGPCWIIDALPGASAHRQVTAVRLPFGTPSRDQVPCPLVGRRRQRRTRVRMPRRPEMRSSATALPRRPDRLICTRGTGNPNSRLPSPPTMGAPPRQARRVAQHRERVPSTCLMISGYATTSAGQCSTAERPTVPGASSQFRLGGTENRRGVATVENPSNRFRGPGGSSPLSTSEGRRRCPLGAAFSLRTVRPVRRAAGR